MGHATAQDLSAGGGVPPPATTARGSTQACAAFHRAESMPPNTAHSYWHRGAAIAQPDAKRAERLSQRVFHEGLRDAPSSAMDYCNFLAAQKDLLQANSILETLAPDDAPGYPAAHLQRAIGYSNLLSQGASDRYLPILSWHLKQAGDPSTEAHWLAWANYFRLTGQIDRSVQSLESVANINPSHWFSVADLYVLDGKPDLAKRSLLMASNAYRLRLGNNPLSIPDRLQLVMAQARSGDYQQASVTLQAGLELDPKSDELLAAKLQLENIALEQSLQKAPGVPILFRRGCRFGALTATGASLCW